MNAYIQQILRLYLDLSRTFTSFVLLEKVRGACGKKWFGPIPKLNKNNETADQTSKLHNYLFDTSTSGNRKLNELKLYFLQ